MGTPLPVRKNSPYDYNFRVLLLGDHHIGKTAVLQKFRKRNVGHYRGRRHSLPDNRILTVEIEITRGDKQIRIHAKDTAGQEKYRSLTASYYRGANGCLVLYDVTRESSFDSITYWLHDLKEYTSQPKISTIIVGTKCHVAPEKREVTFERATKFAESLGLPYMEVSAEEGINVTEVFEKLADLIIENLEKSQAPITIETNRVSLTSQVSKRKHSWCSC